MGSAFQPLRMWVTPAQRARAQLSRRQEWRRDFRPERLALNLPGAVGLPAGRAVALLLLAADDHRLLVFAAIDARLGLVRVARRDRAVVAVVGILPRRRLVAGHLVQRVVGLLRHQPLVVVI